MALNVRNSSRQWAENGSEGTGGKTRRPWITAVFLFIIAAWLILGGAYLLILGGSPGYILTGLAILGSAILLARGSARGVELYWALLLALYVWAAVEAGLDGWALVPRLLGPTIVGLWLLTPVIRRKLDRAGRGGPALLPALTIGVGAFAAILVVATAISSGDPVSRFQDGAVGRVAARAGGQQEWRVYGGDPGGSRYSQLTQIDPASVKNLKIAWVKQVGSDKSDLETTPLKVGNMLYLCNGVDVVYALDPETGQTRWRHDPKVDLKGVVSRHCRGIAYFEDPSLKDCPKRILVGTLDARLIALDAETGRRCSSFGQGGAIDLRRGMGDVPPGYYYVTSPPTVVRGKVAVGGWVLDNQMHAEPPGVVRAFDVRTGAFAWAWDVGRTWTAEPGPGESYTRGTPNSWSLMSADERLGLLFFPTGNATPDYWGGRRTPAMDRYSTSVVAVEAETGRTRWSFQTVHHDVWDYDTASQPVLVDIRRAGGVVPALVQATKQGELFVLDRRTGKPVFPVQERPVPAGASPYDRLSRTQPFSVGMPSFRGPDLRERDMWGLTPMDQLWCRIRFRQARYEGVFTPPGLTPSIQYPGYLGGMNWGSVSIDPERQLLVANSSRLANFVRFLPRAEADRRGIRPMGAPAAPGGRDGRGLKTMGLSPPVHYISSMAGAPFASDAGPFMSPLRVPCAEPPFGRLAVVDLSTGKTRWSRSIGTARDSGPLGIPTMLPIPMGNINQGGVLTTRSGLVFMGATQEHSFRAYDLLSGRLLWTSRLPAGGQATPMSYWSAASGRQFVVIAAGGSRLMEAKAGDYVVAYALPRSDARR